MNPVNPRVRRLARERAVQFLFSLGFTNADPHEARDAFWEAFPSRPTVHRYAEDLIYGVLARVETLDGLIDTALRNWAPGRVGRVERNVLRVALYEILYRNDVPRKVAINEAIEIARTLAGEEAPRFINGVLDRIDFSSAPERCV